MHGSASPSLASRRPLRLMTIAVLAAWLAAGMAAAVAPSFITSAITQALRAVNYFGMPNWDGVLAATVLQPGAGFGLLIFRLLAWLTVMAGMLFAVCKVLLLLVVRIRILLEAPMAGALVQSVEATLGKPLTPQPLARLTRFDAGASVCSIGGFEMDIKLSFSGMTLVGLVAAATIWTPWLAAPHLPSSILQAAWDRWLGLLPYVGGDVAAPHSAPHHLAPAVGFMASSILAFFTNFIIAITALFRPAAFLRSAPQDRRSGVDWPTVCMALAMAWLSWGCVEVVPHDRERLEPLLLVLSLGTGLTAAWALRRPSLWLTAPRA